MLQFRIWHLLARTAVVAIALTAVELLSYRTVTVEFAYSPIIQPFPDLKLPSTPEELLRTLAEDEPSGGLSADLPAALAFLSVFLDRPASQDVACSGVLIADSHDVLVLGPVGEAEYKVRGAYNRNLRMLILPAANRRDLEASPLVPRAVCDEIVRYASSLEEAVDLAFGADVWME